MATRRVSLLRAASTLLLLAGAAYLAGARAGRLPVVPALLAGLAAALVVALTALAATGARTALRTRRLAPACETVAALGICVLVAAGLTNWALGIHGTVLVMQREPVRLSSRAALAGLDMGPLADPRELEIALALARLRLEAVGPDGFRPVSRLAVVDGLGEERSVTISFAESARVGALVLRQGVFGFAPRVVVTRAGTTLLDAHVPFRTIRDGGGMSFAETFELGSERLVLHGAVTLDDLNDDMRGHPRLELAVEREGAPLGGGTLRPGEFVDLDGELRVGFAGLQRWSEVVFSRPNYRGLALVGLLVAMAGLAGLAVASWRRW